MSENFEETLSDSVISELAVESGFVQRTSKLNGRHFLEMLMFANLQSVPASLNDLSAYLSEESDIVISKQGIQERFNAHSVTFLKQLLSLELEKNIRKSDLPDISTQPFNRVRVKDSTRWNLLSNCAAKYKGYGGYKGTSPAMVSIQYEYDLLSGAVIDLSINRGTRNDLKDAKELKGNISKNDLIIRDLGYISKEHFSNIEDKGAFFLNRLPYQMNVYNDSNQAVDFKSIYQSMQSKGLDCIDTQVLIGNKCYSESRMIVVPVSEQIYTQRLALARKRSKDKGYEVSDQYKARARLNVYVTNIEKDKMSKEDVVKLYKSRWQIERVFKVWKSLGKIDKLSPMKVERFECQLLAKLIWLNTNWKVFFVTNHWMYSLDKSHLCSIWKFFKQTLAKPLILRDILWCHANIKTWLTSLFKKAHSTLILETKKNKISYNELYNLLLT